MERKRNRKVKRATIEAAAEKLLDRAGINGGSEKNAEQNPDNAQTTPGRTLNGGRDRIRL